MELLLPVEEILSSEYFDACWYKQKYPDVKYSSISPAEHFLIYGGLLERDAGPKFSKICYPEIYERAKQKNENPLLVFKSLNSEG